MKSLRLRKSVPKDVENGLVDWLGVSNIDAGVGLNDQKEDRASDLQGRGEVTDEG